MKPEMSWVWQFFHKINNTMARCVICQREYSYHSTSHNLKKHLDRKHPTLAAADIEKRDQSTSEEEETEPAEKKPKIMLCPHTGQQVAEIYTADEESALGEVHLEESSESATERELKQRARVRERSAWIWEYFVRVSSVHAECRLCGGKYTYESTIGNLRKHLIGRHPDVIVGDKTKAMAGLKPEAKELADGTEYAEKGRRTSWIWAFFAFVDSRYAVCRLCGRKYSYESSTTNLQKHLERMHQQVVLDKTASRSYKVSASRSSDTEEVDSKEQFTAVYIEGDSSPLDELTPSRGRSVDALEQFGRYVTVLMRRLPEDVANAMQAEFITKIMQAQIEHDKARASKTAQKRSDTDSDNENDQLGDMILEVTES